MSASLFLQRQRRYRYIVLASRIALAVALLALWEYGAINWFDPVFLSSPSRIAAHLMQWASTDLWQNAVITLRETLLGYVAGAIAGIGLGFILSRLHFISDLLDPFIVALNGTPRIALAPLLIIWFGIGETSKVVLAGLLTFFICFYATLAGIRAVERSYIQVAHVLGANERQVLRHIILPGAAPWIVNAMKVSIPFALIGSIVGEFIASTAGLGYMIRLYTSQFDTTGSLAAVTVLMLFVVGLNQLLDWLERRILRWRPRSSRITATEVQ